MDFKRPASTVDQLMRSVAPREALGSPALSHRQHGSIEHAPTRQAGEKSLGGGAVKRVERKEVRFPHRIIADQLTKSVAPREALGSPALSHRKHGSIEHAPTRPAGEKSPDGGAVKRVERKEVRFPHRIFTEK
jgi:hypothetical protein